MNIFLGNCHATAGSFKIKLLLSIKREFFLHGPHLCRRLLFCLYIKAPGLIAGADLEGEEDDGEELSVVEVGEDWVEVGFGFDFATTAVGGVSACKNNISD